MGPELDAEEQFGPYLVYERLGVGGMATVHRALERGIEGFERIVALKRLLPHLAEDASFIKAFVREAKLASLLGHVNIVQIFELGRVGTEYFISMEYINGRDIRRILRHARKVTGPPPINVTVGMLLQLCDALDYAHNKADEEGQPLQLVHRDVSPSNLLVTTAGHLKVIDFGIAKAQSSQLRTQTGRVKGKLAYMAPEAISGKDLDARSDLFAVGVIAHELLTARPLFASKNEYQTLLKVQRGDIMPPSTFNQASPPELDAIVLKALARDPDQRFSSASELRDELLAMRTTYSLLTGYRDISQWVEWAFSLEAPGSGAVGAPMKGPDSAVVEAPRTPVVRHATPRPLREDDDAVEIAWGGGDGDGEDAGPIELDDVPDVSEKHLRDQIRVEVDDSELDDDIPTPVPSHGARPHSRELPVVHPRDSAAFPVVHPRDSAQHPVVHPFDSAELPVVHSHDSAAFSIPRERRGTAPGHTPASGDRISRPSARMMTVTTDPEGRPLIDEIIATASDSDATLLHMKAADTLPTLPRVDDGPPAAPIVRFRATTPPPLGPPVRAIQTKPGHSPARALTALPAGGDAALARSAHEPRPPTRPTLGQAIAARQQQGPKRWWIILAGIVAAGAIATAVTLFVTRGDDTVTTVSEPVQPQVRARTIGTVKFELEPPDAEITIEGTLVHSGSPWQTELESGAHQIQITRTGYKAWLTSLELSANETHVLRVVLQPLGEAQAVAEATLILSSSPSGLEAVLDGTVLPVRTPIKMPIKVGPHTIVLRQDGVDVWTQELVAQASADYEFSPSMDAVKQRERAQRRPPRAELTAPEPAPVPAPVRDEPPVIPVDASAPAPDPAPAPRPDARPASPPPATPPAAPTSPIAPPVAPPTRPAAPITVPPSAVTRRAGSTPEVAKIAGMPSVVAAKVCISHTGRVTSANLITKIDPRAARDIIQALLGWKYEPYVHRGTATAVCFAVSFRLE